MVRKMLLRPFFTALTAAFALLPACKNSNEKEKAASPEELKQKATEMIGSQVNAAMANGGLIIDSLRLKQPELAGMLYQDVSFAPLWFDQQQWKPIADSLFDFIGNSRFFGLFPEDYHAGELNRIRQKFAADTLGKGDRQDVALWSKADLLFTDAFAGIVRDIKLGRLPNDSITLRKDSVLLPDFYKEQLNELNAGKNLAAIVASLEPDQRGYHLIKQGIRKFLDGADYREYTIVPSPKAAPGQFQQLLQKRLFEGGYIAFDSVKADSSQLAGAVKKFQKEKGLAVDGVAGETTLRVLNSSDKEKFVRIAISLDKYKLLPEKMPSRYIWVNIPSYYLDVIENDSVKLTSRTIVGKAKTSTPVLTSAVSVLITYPQWVPPPSIVRKEILPAVKKNPGYLQKKGFSLVNSKGEEVDPYSVDWSKYSNGIPYRVVQGSGDANALGIMKFHFDNKYSVYLHDTNQRYLFSGANRSLSHGCVRVQEWEKLAWYILRNDSLQSGPRTATRIDSVQSWLNAKKKRNVVVRNKMPVYIRYITCEGKDNGIVFFDDPYREDELLRSKYFAGK